MVRCEERGFTPFPPDIFGDVQRLVVLRNEFGCDPLPRDEDRKRSIAYNGFVSRFLTRASKSLSMLAPGDTAKSKVIRSIQLGQILFLYTVCPAMSVSGVYSQSIAVALRDFLEGPYELASGESVLWSPDVLCWLLFNGAITKQAKPLQGWYLRQLRELLKSQRIAHFQQVESLLRKVCWLEEQFGVACRAVYEDLAENE